MLELAACQPSHHEERVQHHHLLLLEAVLISTIGPCAGVAKLANSVRVDVKAFVAVRALREELTLFRWMVVLAFIAWLVAVGPESALDLLLGVG